MKNISPSKANITLKPPESMEGIGDMEAFRYSILDTETGNQCSAYMVAFELNNEEKEIISKTGKIYLHVYGDSFPPIMPTVYTMEEKVGEDHMEALKGED